MLHSYCLEHFTAGMDTTIGRYHPTMKLIEVVFLSLSIRTALYKVIVSCQRCCDSTKSHFSHWNSQAVSLCYTICFKANTPLEIPLSFIQWFNWEWNEIPMSLATTIHKKYYILLFFLSATRMIELWSKGKPTVNSIPQCDEGIIVYTVLEHMKVIFFHFFICCGSVLGHAGLVSVTMK